MRKLLLGSVACLVLGISLFAASPHLISYQGRLTDPGGNPVTDNTYSVIFSIYDVPSGGTAIWSETQNVTTSDGLFSVMLGSVSPLDPAVVLADSSRYLSLQVGGDPELTPRTRLTSVPYSFRSDAGGGWIINANGIVEEQPTRKVGIGTLFPNEAQLEVWDSAGTGYAAKFYGTSDGIYSSVTGNLDPGFDMKAIEGYSINQQTGGKSTGVLGDASGVGDNRGGYFIAGNGLNSNIGIEGESDGSSGNCIGVKGIVTGQTSSSSKGGYFSSDEIGVDIGVGQFDVTTSRYGRFGVRADIYGKGTSVTYGLAGQANQGQDVYGVLGNAANGTAVTYGVAGSAFSTQGDCIGIRGEATGSFSSSSIGGYFTSDQLGVDISVGQYGVTTSRSYRFGLRADIYGKGTSTTYGLAGQANQGGDVYGVLGNAANGTSASYGLYGSALGSSPINYGLYATAINGSVNYAGYFSKGDPGAVTPAANSIVVMENSTSGYLSIVTPDANERGILFGEPSNEAAGGIIYNSGSVPDGLSFRTFNNSTRMVITGAGNVGMGTNVPGARLHVKGAGYPASFGFFDTDGAAQDAGLRFLEAGAAKSHLFHQASTNTLNLFGEGYSGISVNSIGSVGIGTTAPNYALDVRGTIGNNATLYHSDRRWKDHIETLSNSLDRIRKLRGVSFDWKRNEFNEMNFPEGKQIGLIAQEVEKVVPEVVNTADDGYKSVDYAKLVSLLIEAVKDQQNQIESEQSQIEELKAQIRAMAVHGSDNSKKTFGQR